MGGTVFYKKDGDVSSVRKKITDNILITSYKNDDSRGGLTLKSKYVSARIGKDFRLISYGFGDGNKMSYFSRDHKKLEHVGQF